jgi:hypothetical protein
LIDEVKAALVEVILVPDAVTKLKRPDKKRLVDVIFVEETFVAVSKLLSVSDVPVAEPKLRLLIVEDVRDKAFVRVKLPMVAVWIFAWVRVEVVMVAEPMVPVVMLN